MAWCNGLLTMFAATTGVIGGLVAYIICSGTRRALDWGSAHTNGAFGRHSVKEDIEGPKTRERTNHLKPTKSMELPPDDVPPRESSEVTAPHTSPDPWNQAQLIGRPWATAMQTLTLIVSCSTSSVGHGAHFSRTECPKKPPFHHPPQLTNVWQPSLTLLPVQEDPKMVAVRQPMEVASAPGKGRGDDSAHLPV